MSLILTHAILLHGSSGWPGFEDGKRRAASRDDALIGPLARHFCCLVFTAQRGLKLAHFEIDDEGLNCWRLLRPIRRLP